MFVFPENLRAQANQLFLALKNGIGPFRGTEALFGFRLTTENVERLPPFSVDQLDDHRAAKVYEDAIARRLASEPLDADLALILHRRTERTDQLNPYLSSKFPLLQAGIPTQVVTEELLERSDTFQWSAANIALAMFVKMGGQPWAVESPLSADTLVVGIDRAIVGGSRFYGFATTFDHDGLYLGTTLFSPARGWDAYLTEMEHAIDAAIAGWREDVGRPVTLVLHVRRDFAHDERRVLERCLRRADRAIVRGYSVLRVADPEHVTLLDPGDESGIPEAGVLVPLASHRALLQIAGRDPQSVTFGKVIGSGPWQITRLDGSETAPPFEVLCSNILALSAMNWGSFNAEAAPITVKYPGQLATLLGRFAEAGFPIEALQDAPIFRRVWFI